MKTPTVLQMEAVECGAAALAIILAYHKRFEPLETLRVACGVSRDGSKASNLLRAARTYGLAAKGFKVEPKDLPEKPVPLIAHWNFNHFVVFEGFVENRAHLNDPAVGPRTVSVQEFDEAFTGVALTFEPTDNFTPGGRPPGLLRGLVSRLDGAWSALIYVVLAGLALVIPGLLEPAFQKVFVDNVLIQGLADWVPTIVLAMAGTTVLYAGLLHLRQSHLLTLEMKMALTSSAQFFWHVLRLPVGFFTQRSSGDLSTRVGLNDRVARLLSNDLARNALNVVVIAFYGGLMLLYDAGLTLLVLVVAAANVAALKYVSRRRTDLNMRLQQERGALVGTAMSGLQSIETLKATGAEADFFTRWSGHHAKVVNAQQTLGLYSQVLAVVPPFLIAASTALILGFGGMRIMDGSLTIGMLVGFQVLASSFLAPVNQMVALGSTMQEVESDMKRIDDVLQHDLAPDVHVPAIRSKETPPPSLAPSSFEKPLPTTTRASAKLSGRLELKNVTFGYSRLEPPLIETFSLHLSPGTRVALVGGSGSGKSTIARLVCGLYAPWDGEILFDERSRRAIDPDVMATSFAVVDQQIFLFKDTVRNNLSLWDTTIPESDLVQAARDACIHDEIVSRPGGYDRVLAEDGSNFSGGQRQRLEIARALATNPSIVVLDEATSALDPTTEKAIDDHLRRRGCTCLIVAHRLSTIRDCDEILVLDAGRVVQRGRHDALIRDGGPYAALLDSM